MKALDLEISWDSGAKQLRVSLDEALGDLLEDRQELAKQIVARLVDVALTGKGLTSLKAIELLFARVDGPVVQRHEVTAVPMQRVVLSSPAVAEGLAAARLGLLSMQAGLSETSDS